MARILLVEDQLHNMRLMEQIIGDIDETWEVVKADTGLKALKLAEHQHFDLVLMDIALPDLDGLLVTERLRDYPHLTAVPVVAVTAYAMLADEERFRMIFQDYIAKPVDEEKMVEIIKKWVVIDNGNQSTGR